MTLPACDRIFPLAFSFLAAATLLAACGADSSSPIALVPTPAPPPPAGTLGLKWETVAGGFVAPVFVAAPAGDARLFVVEKAGQIKIIQNGTVLPAPFLDIASRVSSDGERGLLSMAFHPQFASNKQFFIYFTDSNGDIKVERYVASSSDANKADAGSASPVISIPHPTFGNHNGGQLAFGPDGFLYIGTGDGGGGGDPFKYGQNNSALLAKILRLDVATLPYKIPANNPFATSTSNAKEIWAYGVRNPWRFSFDAVSAKLYMGDVGQNEREEINVADTGAAGLNYGWSTTEGTQCYGATSCDKAGITLPAVEHTHPGSASITGGYVYRGANIPSLQGTYFYGDFAAGWVKSFVYAGGAATEQKDWASLNLPSLASFGVDAAGELYGVSLSGTIYRLVIQ
jgi:glucose/arabinose dehydrogenase